MAPPALVAHPDFTHRAGDIAVLHRHPAIGRQEPLDQPARLGRLRPDGLDRLRQLRRALQRSAILRVAEEQPDLAGNVHGGTVVIGARTGTRNEDNHVIRETAPGTSLSQLTGVRVEDFGRLAAPGANGLFDVMERSGGLVIPPNKPAESHRRERRFKIGNRELAAGYFYENLATDGDVEVVAAWSNRYAEGQPMATSRKVGKGQVVYVGTYLTPDLTAALAGRLFAPVGIEPLIGELPEGVEVTMA